MKKYFIVVAEKTHQFYMQYKSLSELAGTTPPSGYTLPRMVIKARRYEVIETTCQKIETS